MLMMLGASALWAQSPKMSKVWEYRPAPGQFVNDLPKYAPGDDAEAMARKAQYNLVDIESMVSLGGYGGYIVFSFDHPIKNVHGKYNFKILGNALYAAANPNPNASAKGGSCEPGIVMVSRDANGNGLPDDAWYELAGSEYNSPKTIHNYRVTYTRPADMTKAVDVPWTDNTGATGAVHANSYHTQPYYPQWIDESTMVFEGTKLAQNAIDESGKGNYWVLYAYPWGYVDNEINISEFSNFKIDWAVDAAGNHVDLDEIHFIKVYTGVNQEAGWLGETSTEVAGALDWNMLGGYDTVTICGNSYRWNGKNYDRSGDYYHALKSKAKLDSSVTLHLTLNPVYNIEQTATACRSYTWRGETYNESGVYSKTLTSSCGCDSIITLNLTIVDSYEQTVNAVSCDGSYVWLTPKGDTIITESGSFTKRFQTAGGCDSVVTLNLSMGSASTNHAQATICGGSYTWEGQTYTKSGQYTRTFASAMGCDSVVTLHLNFTDVLRTEISHTTCDSYEWEGETYNTSGVYTKTLTSLQGCDSIVTLNLVLGKTIKYNELGVKACVSYTWNGKTYIREGNTQSNEYTDYFIASNGCDSIVTKYVDWKNMLIETKHVSACGSYVWHTPMGDTTITQSGLYTKKFKSVCDCDSTVKLNLTIVDNFSSSFSATACGSYVWHTPKGDTTITESGQFTKKFVSVGGCDSTVTLNLTIKTPVTHEFTATSCGAYWWNGIVYAASGDYQQVFRARNGCDSTVTMHLTIDQPTLIEKDVSVCGSYTHGGVTYMRSGVQTAVYGCDSTVRLNITVNPIHNVAFGQTACGSHEWEGETYTTGGVYTKKLTSSLGCDSIVTMDLQLLQPKYHTINDTVCGGTTWQNEQYVVSGTYAHTIAGGAANGCDSTVMLELVVRPEHAIQFTDTVLRGAGYSRHGFNLTETETQKSGVHSLYLYLKSEHGCDSIVRLQLTVLDATDVPAALAEQVRLQPNPSSGTLMVSGTAPFNRAEVYSTTGQLVHSCPAGYNQLTLNLNHLPAGVYTLRLSGRQATITRRFVKM